MGSRIYYLLLGGGFINSRKRLVWAVSETLGMEFTMPALELGWTATSLLAYFNSMCGMSSRRRGSTPLRGLPHKAPMHCPVCVQTKSNVPLWTWRQNIRSPANCTKEYFNMHASTLQGHLSKTFGRPCDLYSKFLYLNGFHHSDGVFPY